VHQIYALLDRHSHKYNGQKFIKMHARLSAEQFYRKLGYVDMPFDDPSIQKEYINLGKEL